MAQDGVERSEDGLKKEQKKMKVRNFPASCSWVSKGFPHREVQHAVLQHKVVGPLDVLALLQTGVVDAGVREAARQVGARQRLRDLGDRHGVTQLLHVLGEEVGVAHVEGRHGRVEGRHGDGGDLRSDCRQKKKYVCVANT